MAETIEDVQRGRSWMPLAMTAAFIVGASIAGWFVFREQLQAWARLEDLAWEPTAGDRATLVQHDRERRVVSGESDRVVDADTEWTLVADSAARVPGQALSWTQTLRGGSWEVRAGDVVVASSNLVAPDPTTPPQKREPPDPQVPGPVALLDALVALDLGMGLDAAGVTATSATPPEAVDQIETRRTGVPLDERKPLDPMQGDAVQADLGVYAQRAAFDASACLPADLYRPGQTFTREIGLPLGEWGTHVVRLELSHDGYDGDVALLSGTIARRSSDGGALSSEDGLSGLKGEIQCRYDVRARHVVAGHYSLEARGKSSRKFATLGIDHAWALAGPTQAAAIPADLELAQLPPPGAPPSAPAP